MKIIDTVATREALPFNHLISALKAMFIEGCNVPPRHTHTLADANGDEAGTAYFSPSWTVFQADRGRDFSVIVDGISN